MSKTTVFEEQSPTETVVEISAANYDDKLHKFVDFKLDIEWAMKTINNYHPIRKRMKNNKCDFTLGDYEHSDDYRITKRCTGVLVFPDESSMEEDECPRKYRAVRPQMDKKGDVIKNILCSLCNKPLQ